jgi:hypothetical protein
MSSNRPIILKQERQRLANAAMDAYLCWRDECDAVWGAYHRWLAAAEADAWLAFQAYAAALDREERACDVYAGLVKRADGLAVHAAGRRVGRGAVARRGGQR